VFALSVVLSLVRASVLRPRAILALATRELGELPLAAWLLVSRRGKQAGHTHVANRLGKLTTTLQFAALAAALVRSRSARLVLGLTAAGGAIPALAYGQGGLRMSKRLG